MLECEKVYLVEETFIRNEDYEGQKGEISLEIKWKTAKNKDEKAKLIKLELKAEIGKPENKEIPFYYEIKVNGFFSVEGIKTSEAEEVVKQEGREILLSFVRTHLYEYLLRAGISPLILPNIPNNAKE